ncbi:MAG: DUF3703 domain-containing protein [Thalassotalea sp.]
MSKRLKKYLSIEMLKAKTAIDNNDYVLAFHHLERAHILSQNYTLAHCTVHWWMCKLGYKQRAIKEVFGQLSRLLGALVFSKLWVPTGNTGGTNVSAFKSMPIPDDLAKILTKYS